MEETFALPKVISYLYACSFERIHSKILYSVSLSLKEPLKDELPTTCYHSTCINKKDMEGWWNVFPQHPNFDVKMPWERDWIEQSTANSSAHLLCRMSRNPFSTHKCTQPFRFPSSNPLSASVRLTTMRIQSQVYYVADESGGFNWDSFHQNSSGRTQLLEHLYG